MATANANERLRARRAARRDASIAANREDRHNQLLDIAGQMFAERGFLATTTREIADAANILPGSLYHHFSSKESIADELLSAYWTDLLEIYERVASEKPKPTEGLRQLVGASIAMLGLHQYAVRMVLNDWTYLSGVLPYLQENLNRVEAIWVDLLKRGQRAKEFDPRLNPQVTYRTIMSSISGTARWYSPDGSMTTDELAEQMATLFLAGVELETTGTTAS
jgi:AcrR family transcriptional regulator